MPSSRRRPIQPPVAHTFVGARYRNAALMDAVCTIGSGALAMCCSGAFDRIGNHRA